jgi:hypothetical protein
MGLLLSELIFQVLPSSVHSNARVAEPLEFNMGPEASQSTTPSALHSDVVLQVTETEDGSIKYFRTGHFLKKAFLSFSTDAFGINLP